MQFIIKQCLTESLEVPEFMNIQAHLIWFCLWSMFANAQILFINVLRGVYQSWAVELPLNSAEKSSLFSAKNADEDRPPKNCDGIEQPQ